MLLQSATAFFITKCDSFFITKCDKCYNKVRQVLQGVTILLQSATGITKCDDYYKVRQYIPPKIQLVVKAKWAVIWVDLPPKIQSCQIAHTKRK